MPTTAISAPTARRKSVVAPAIILSVGILLASALAYALSGGPRSVAYGQSSPDDVIRSAVSMIKNGQTRNLTNLIYADGPEMRAVLNQLGRTLESMQHLSVSSAKRFPAEFQKLQDDALAAAEDPKNKSLVAQLMVGMNEFGNGKSSGRQPNADDVRNAFSAILADPFGWIDRNAARLSAKKTADDTASVMFDGEPAIPVVGLPMRMENGKWFIQLPLSMPPLSGVMPRTPQQWSILGSVFKVTENAMVELQKDVEAGRVSGLKGLTDKFQEKVLFPIAIAFASYAKELDVRGRAERGLSAYKTRQRAWVEARKKAAPEGTPGVSPKLLEALASLAPEKAEQTARANKRLGVDKMSDAEFEDLLASWFKEAKLGVRVTGDLFGDAVDSAVSAWQTERKAAKPPKKK